MDSEKGGRGQTLLHVGPKLQQSPKACFPLGCVPCSALCSSAQKQRSPERATADATTPCALLLGRVFFKAHRAEQGSHTVFLSTVAEETKGLPLLSCLVMRKSALLRTVVVHSLP